MSNLQLHHQNMHPLKTSLNFLIANILSCYKLPPIFYKLFSLFSLKSFIFFSWNQPKTTHINSHLSVYFVFSSSVEMYTYNFRYRILMVYTDLYLQGTEINMNKINTDNSLLWTSRNLSQSSRSPSRTEGTQNRGPGHVTFCLHLCFSCHGLILFSEAYFPLLPDNWSSCFGPRNVNAVLRNP